MIRYPKPKHPDYGLYLRNETWFVFFYDGKRIVQKSTFTTDLFEAREFRDKLYAGLRELGGDSYDFRPGNSGRKKHLPPGIDKLPENVFYRPPYQVRIKGRKPTNHWTLEDATTAAKV